MTCRFCLWRPSLGDGGGYFVGYFDACFRCAKYLEELAAQGYDALRRQLINLANVRWCRLAAG